MTTHVTLPLSKMTLSGLEAVPEGDAPLATVVALHGGGYDAGYWDYPHGGDASLLSIGARLGYRIVALDRPGYEASFGIGSDASRLDAQAPVVFEAIDALGARDPLGAGVFLAGHSMGAMLAMRMAATEWGNGLLGLAVSGHPLEFAEGYAERIRDLEGLEHRPRSDWQTRRTRFYGPDGTFDTEVRGYDEAVSRPVPVAEVVAATRTALESPEVMARVCVPVQYVYAEFEASSIAGPEMLERAEGFLSAAPRVELVLQAGAAHNISLHRVARAHHLRIFAFFDEVLASRRRSGSR